MKKNPFWAIMLCFSLAACSKSNNPDPAIPENYMNMRAGSLWNYEVQNNTPPPTTSLYTLTSTSKDSTINSKSYHVFMNSANGASEYYFATGTDYYTFQSLPGAVGDTKVEYLYLKSTAAVNTTWSQIYNIVYNSVPLKVTAVNKIEGKGIDRTVNGKIYSNVIHVSTKLSVEGIPPASLVTSIHYYYAPNVGMIENTSKINLDYVGIMNNSDFTTTLKTATLQ